jgi:arylsulfatase A-like enzyme/Flp pilus assembly protein TadD
MHNGSRLLTSRWLAAAIVLLIGVAWSWRLRTPRTVARDGDLSVLLITIDTLRADAIGAYGNRAAETPWIDRLAAAGARFDRAHAHNVVTLASHANLLSGRYPFDHGVRDNSGFRFPATIDTLATLLKARGYRTAAFVSAFPLDSRFGLARGFDVYDDTFVDAIAQRPFLEPERAGRETVARARAWLDAQHGARTLCWVHLYEPHYPYQPPEPFAARFRSDPYAGEVAAVDAALGPLVEPILGAGADGRTLVVLTADHGESLGDHREATHGIFAYESTLRVPLIFYQPRLWRPVAVTAAARHVDVLPTILDALGAAPPRDVAGRSLLPALAGDAQPEVPSYFEALSASFNRGWAPLTGVIVGSRKYIDLPIPEVYDLADDPQETHNLTAAQPDTARQLRAALTALNARDRPAPAAETRETRERLGSLGYIAGVAARPEHVSEADDPKRLIDLDSILQDVVERYEAGDLGAALDRCRELVRRRPTMAVSLMYLAQLEHDSGNLHAAIDAMRRAVALVPAHPETIALLGGYLTEAGQPRDAVALLEHDTHAEDPDPQIVTAYALALARSGRTDDAVTTLTAARHRHPSSPAVLVELGTVHLMAGRRAEARHDFEEAVTLDAGAARAHSSLGALAAEDGHIDEAFTHWRQAVAADPRELDALLALGTMQWRAGRVAAARPYLEFFLSVAPPEKYARPREVVGAWLGRGH